MFKYGKSGKASKLGRALFIAAIAVGAFGSNAYAQKVDARDGGCKICSCSPTECCGTTICCSNSGCRSLH